MPLNELRQEVVFGLENLTNVYQNITRFSALQSDATLKTSALAYECLGYYNAAEHLMIRILKHLAQEIPSGAFSHRNILKSFRSQVDAQKISDTAAIDTLENLMAFRHVATKIYGFLIDWAKLSTVVNDIQDFHPRIVALFQAVVDHLEE